MRTLLTSLVAVLLFGSVLAVPAAGAAGGVHGSDSGLEAGTAAGPGTDAGDDCAGLVEGSRQPDPDADRLGWENGCWANATLAVSQRDGLNDTELDAVVSRAMARVETIREREFTADVSVVVRSRAAYRANTTERFAALSADARRVQNAKYEALFMIGEDADAVDVQAESYGTMVGGFYSPENDRIVLVTESADEPRIHGPTLAHELVHALQDQQFDLSRYSYESRDQATAVAGLVEGDAALVDHRYGQRCGGEWSCLRRSSSVDRSAIHGGLFLLFSQPYGDGGVLVRRTLADGGWTAVDAMYDDPPASTEQTIHPARYGTDEPAAVTVTDRSTDEWRRVQASAAVAGGAFGANASGQRLDAETLGEASMAAMFIYPSLESGFVRNLVSPRQFVNRTDSGQRSSFDPFNFTVAWTDGWAGDTLVVYASEDAGEGEQGYVWKTVWDTEADAREFADGYRELLSFRGASAVDGADDTYRIPDDRSYGDAFHVNRTGDAVVVVNAPTVEALADVRAGSGPATQSTTTTEPGTATPATATTATPAEGTATATETAAPTTTARPPESTTARPATTGSGPGFGVPGGVVAFAVALALVARRDRSR